ncbi:MAG: hypothetical protein ACRD2C_01140 [Acidimicrobiales bacterium]
MGNAAPTARRADGPITRDDLESKMRELVDGARDEVASTKNTVASVGIVVGLILLLVVFLLGRRSGRKRSTVVEIRRV